MKNLTTKNSTQVQIDLQLFYSFARLSNEQKISELNENGVFLESDQENDLELRLYFLHGFFVEVTINKKDNTLIEIIPFKRGYKLDNYLELKQVYVPKSRSGRTNSPNKGRLLFFLNNLLIKSLVPVN